MRNGLKNEELIMTRKIEETMESMEIRYRSMFENAVSGIFQTTPDGRYLDANPALAHLYGYESCQEMISQLTNIEQQLYVDPKRRDEFTSTLQEHDQVSKFESQIYRQDGSIIWISESARAVRDELGSLLYYEGFVEDITQRKRAEAALKESEERLRLVIEGVRDYAIFMLDPQGFVTSWNQGAQRLLGYESQEIIGKSFSCFFPEEKLTPEQIKSKLEMVCREGRLEIEGIKRRRDQSFFWANVITTALYDENHQLLGFSQVIRDITERKQSQEALKQANEELEKRVQERTFQLEQVVQQLRNEIRERQEIEKALLHSQGELENQKSQLEKTLMELQETQAQLIHNEKMSVLGELVAGVAHEINNPVSCVCGNLVHVGNYTRDLLHLIELYQQHYPDVSQEIQTLIHEMDMDFLMEDLPQAISSMQIGADRIREIVRSLRNFSRKDDEEVMNQTNLHEGIEGTLVILQTRFKSRNNYPEIKLVKNYGNLPLVTCYVGKMNQVFMNLLSNAIDAIEQYNQEQSLEEVKKNPGKITISTEAKEDNVIIKISDNGMGMTPEIHQRLFDSFFTTKPVGKGTGLGLAIAYRVIVEEHKGSLVCHSQPNQGAEFVITIPLNPAP